MIPLASQFTSMGAMVVAVWVVVVLWNRTRREPAARPTQGSLLGFLVYFNRFYALMLGLTQFSKIYVQDFKRGTVET